MRSFDIELSEIDFLNSKMLIFCLVCAEYSDQMDSESLNSGAGPLPQAEASHPHGEMENITTSFVTEETEPHPAPLSGDSRPDFPEASEEVAVQTSIPPGVPSTTSTAAMGGMTGWSRAIDTPLNEPSEELIIRCCESIAPARDEDDTKLRSIIRHYMLSGRDYWNGAFARYPSLIGYALRPHPELRIMRDPPSVCAEVEDRKPNKGLDRLCGSPAIPRVKFFAITPWEEIVPVSQPPLLGISLACCARKSWTSEF